MKAKKILAVFMALVMAAFTPAAYADTHSLVNSGDDVSVTHSNTHTVNINASSYNTSSITQTATGSLNTGGNTADGNIDLGGGSGSSIQTGSAAFSAGFDAAGNTSTVGVMPTSTTMGTHSSSVVNTGDGLTFDTDVLHELTINANNTNSLSVNQNATASLNTGSNTSSDNIGGSGITTGNAVFTGSFDAPGNTGAVMVGGSFGNGMVSMDELVNTGDGLTFTSSSTSTSNVSAASVNVLSLYQYSNTSTNTGGNASLDNIGSGLVRTGGAGAGVTFDGTGNAGITTVGGGTTSATLLTLLLSFWSSLVTR